MKNSFNLFIVLLVISSCSLVSTTGDINRAPAQFNSSCNHSSQSILSTDETWKLLRPTPWGNFEFETFEFYQQYKRVLRLADGREGAQQAKILSERIPEIQIVTSDYNFDKTAINGNYKKIQLDNTKPLPFQENSFDAIVMRQGLCTCHQSCKTCGGFDLSNSNQIYDFFKEIIRVLDNSNPNAKAYLHGGRFKDYDYAIAVYREAAHKIMKEYPEMRIIFLKNTKMAGVPFLGFLIRPAI